MCAPAALHTRLGLQQQFVLHEQGYRYSLEEGDYVYAFFNALALAALTLQYDLERCAQQTQGFYLQAVERGEERMAIGLLVQRQAAFALMGRTSNPASMDDEHFNEEATLQRCAIMKATLETAQLISERVWLLVIAGDLDAASRVTLEGRSKRVPEHFTTSVGHVFHCFIGMVAMSVDALAKGRPRSRRAVRYFYNELQWLGRVAPVVYAGVALYSQALKAALRGDAGRATSLFDRALQVIEVPGYRLLAAVAFEHAGRYLIRRGVLLASQPYLTRAWQLYRVCKAEPKAQALQREFAFLDSELVHAPGAIAEGTPHTVTAHGFGHQGDLASVLEAARQMADEKSVSTLANSVLGTLMNSAAADRGAIILRQAEGLNLVALRGGDPQAPSLPVRALGSQLISDRVVQYVSRSGEQLMLDADTLERDWADPYFDRFRPKAVFCAPLRRQGELLGLVYLENHAAPIALNNERKNLIVIIAAHAALALSSALIYGELEKQVSARTLELHGAQAQLLKLQRENTELQMAGGFAHEMRNALAGANMVITDVTGSATEELPLGERTRRVVDATVQVLQRIDSSDARSAHQALHALGESLVLLDDGLRGVQHAIERALRITHSILDYARMGSMHPGADTTDVEVTCRSILASIERSIAVDLAMPAGTCFAIAPEHLHSIVNNLVLNARDAHVREHAAAQPSIHITGRIDAADLMIEVVDNAGGMPQEVAERVFEPFFSTGGADNTGLGLPMVKKLVELYGGSISMTTQAGEGTRFAIKLPVDLPAA